MFSRASEPERFLCSSLIAKEALKALRASLPTRSTSRQDIDHYERLSSLTEPKCIRVLMNLVPMRNTPCVNGWYLEVRLDTM